MNRSQDFAKQKKIKNNKSISFWCLNMWHDEVFRSEKKYIFLHKYAKSDFVDLFFDGKLC